MILGNKSPKQTEGMKKCENLLNKLCTHRHATYFLQPVDPIALNIPDYPKIIKEPMDLGTIRKRLKAKEYRNPGEMLTDITKVWSNSFLYNPLNSSMHSITKSISDYFQSIYQQYIDNPLEEMSPPRTKLTKERSKESADYLPPGIKIPFPGFMADRPLTYEEKRILTEMIKSKRP